MRRVMRGVALLDARVPGWEKSIDLSVLDVSLHDTCVIGQIWGGSRYSFDYGCNDLDLASFREARDFGFEAYTRWGFRRLTERWTEVVKARTERRLVVVPPVKRVVTGEVITFTGYADEAECFTDEPSDMLVGQ